MLKIILQILSGVLAAVSAYLEWSKKKVSKKASEWRVGYDLRKQRRIEKARVAGLRSSVTELLHKEDSSKSDGSNT